MSHPMLPLLERTPVIPAVKEPETLDLACHCDGAAVFLLCGDILNIAGLVDKDCTGREAGGGYGESGGGTGPRRLPWTICAPAEPTGSSPPDPHHPPGRELGMLTVLRVFAIDSKAVSNLGKETGMGMPDLIEVLPGTIYRVIARLSRELPVPLIAGACWRTRPMSPRR